MLRLEIYKEIGAFVKVDLTKGKYSPPKKKIIQLYDRLKNTLNENYSYYSIEGIGKECDFRSKSAFYNAFKKICRMSPAAFRKEFTTQNKGLFPYLRVKKHSLVLFNYAILHLENNSVNLWEIPSIVL